MPDPLIPATVAFRADGTPYSPRYNDIYHSAVGSLAQAHYVFLQGNGLPGRWQQQRTFTVLEIGFGMGVNFLATWAAWRADSGRCERLHFVSIEKHPFSAGDLRRAYAATIDDQSIAALAETLALLSVQRPREVRRDHRGQVDLPAAAQLHVVASARLRPLREGSAGSVVAYREPRAPRGNW